MNEIRERKQKREEVRAVPAEKIESCMLMR